MRKLRAVIRHEYLTIVKQPTFWIVMLAIPALMGVIFAISYFGQVSSQARIEEAQNELQNVVVVDESGLLNQKVIDAASVKMGAASQIDTFREDVRTGESDALIVYPASLTETRTYKLYVSSNDITKMSSASALAGSLLQTSLFLPLGSPEIIALAQTGAQPDTVVYKNGELSAGINEYLVPGLFVILFVIILTFSVSYMLASISEEKENRSMEMVLTYVKPRTLVVGKLLAVSLVTLTQIAFFGLITIASFIISNEMNGGLSLPLGLDLSKAVFDPMAIFFGLAFLIVGFLMYAGLMVTTAAATPSAKEANNFSAVFILSTIMPFYFISLVVTAPDNPVVQFITYFPLTAPIVNLVRNTVGNISPLEAWLALASTTLFMVLSIWVAIRAFKLGALEFSQKIPLGSMFKR